MAGSATPHNLTLIQWTIRFQANCSAFTTFTWLASQGLTNARDEVCEKSGLRAFVARLKLSIRHTTMVGRGKSSPFHKINVLQRRFLDHSRGCSIRRAGMRGAGSRR